MEILRSLNVWLWLNILSVYMYLSNVLRSAKTNQVYNSNILTFTLQYLLWKAFRKYGK